MASNQDFVDFVFEQIQDAGEMKRKLMFGDYGFFCNGKFFGMMSDNQFLIKITDGGKNKMPDCPLAIPYEGAKEYFLIEELDDKVFLKEIIQITCEELPEPKPKKKKRAEKELS